mmetsp:Transcript_73367/g.123557  ORF Transcript_73367/g.123557 Transcript_73367/m.123557 type:complete len:380 (+) Transcript_73367:828-1967(+)
MGAAGGSGPPDVPARGPVAILQRPDGLRGEDWRRGRQRPDGGGAAGGPDVPVGEAGVRGLPPAAVAGRRVPGEGGGATVRGHAPGPGLQRGAPGHGERDPRGPPDRSVPATRHRCRVHPPQRGLGQRTADVGQPRRSWAQRGRRAHAEERAHATPRACAGGGPRAGRDPRGRHGRLARLPGGGWRRGPCGNPLRWRLAGDGDMDWDPQGVDPAHGAAPAGRWRRVGRDGHRGGGPHRAGRVRGRQPGGRLRCGAAAVLRACAQQPVLGAGDGPASSYKPRRRPAVLRVRSAVVRPVRRRPQGPGGRGRFSGPEDGAGPGRGEGSLLGGRRVPRLLRALLQRAAAALRTRGVHGVCAADGAGAGGRRRVEAPAPVVGVLV